MTRFGSGCALIVRMVVRRGVRRPWIACFAAVMIVALAMGPIPSAQSLRLASGSAQSAMSPVSRAIRSSANPQLPPHIIAACNVGLGETVVSAYNSAVLGVIKLRCGDGGSGYVHIRERHQRDWQQVVNLAGGGGN